MLDHRQIGPSAPSLIKVVPRAPSRVYFSQPPYPRSARNPSLHISIRIRKARKLVVFARMRSLGIAGYLCRLLYPILKPPGSDPWCAIHATARTHRGQTLMRNPDRRV